MAYISPNALWRDSYRLQLDTNDVQRGSVQEVPDETTEYLEYEAERAELERVSALSKGEQVPVKVLPGLCKLIRGKKDHVDDFEDVCKRKKNVVTATLGPEQKAAIVDSVMEKEMDNMLLLQKMQAHFDKIGLDFPSCDVQFKNITAQVDVYTGSRSIPTLWNAVRSMGECVAGPMMQLINTNKTEKKTLTILDGVSGTIKRGRLTLLLGAPGSGKSTLLRVLSGQLKDKDVKLQGEVTYNGAPFKDFVVERTAAYIDQVDKHIAEMTVRETMAFSARMMGQGYGQDPMIQVVGEKEKESGVPPDNIVGPLLEQIHHGKEGDSIMVDIMARMLGLDVCIDTVIGNDLLKGVSGGQRKRVTTGEMTVGRMPVLMMDEISTGLDSASTFLITKALRNLCHSFRTSVMIALLQPSPETYEVFDDILLLGEGKIMYHGPREEAMPFIASLGLQRPPRKAEADFLQEVTSKVDQKVYWADKSAKYKYLGCKDIAEKFQASTEGKARAAEIATKIQYTELDMAKLKRERFGLTSFGMVKHLFIREGLLIKRMKAFVILRSVQTILLAFATSTLFVQQPKNSTNDANYFMSVCFFSAMFMFMGGFAEVPVFVLRLPVFFKQRNYNFYPAWAYTLSGSLSRIPDNTLMVTLWTLLVYWVVGFYASAGQFFIFWVVLLCMYTFSTAVFRTIAAITRDTVVAQACAAGMMVLCINTCGFTLDRGSIPPWWIWMYWINPMAYVIRALLVNEMNTDDWDDTITLENGETSTIGIFSLEARSYQTQTWWVWVCVGALIGVSVGLTALQAVVLTYFDPLKGSGAAVSEDVDDEGKEGDAEEGAEKAKQVSLGFTPFTLAFRDIKYFVPRPGGENGEEIALLKGVSGCFAPGVLTALMGASGAGKTTLMDVLAGRKTGGRAEGEQLLNGHTKVQSTFSRVMGYVEQFDIHTSQATVREALLFSGKIRLPGDMDSAKVETFVDEVMDLVELRPLANALIGLPGESGLSVEQRKRLTIAVELVANPSVVFMDEPTSGLDARAASIVMRAVRNTVNTGRTVVCTIHQPSLEIFQAFDELLLLKRGGETIFFGPMGIDQVNLIEHFESIPGVEKFRPGYNPANWMLDVSSPGAEITLGVDFAQKYREGKMAQQAEKRLEEVCKPVEGSEPLSFDHKFSVSYFRQVKLILKRNFTTYWRSPSYNVVRFMITVFCGLVFGSLYWDIGQDVDTATGVLNIMGVLFSSTTFLAVANAMIVLPVIHNERVVFYRERASGMFSPGPFAIAQGIVEAPYLIVQAVVYTQIIYWMVGFDPSVAKYFWFFLFNFLNLTSITYFGIMAINLTPAPEFGTVLVAFFFTLWNLLCGFLMAQPDIPGWWIWVYWSNPITYVLYGLAASQLGDYHTTYINAAQPGEPENLVSVSVYLEDVFGFKHSFIGWCVLILFAFIVFFRALSVTALFKFNFQKR